MRKLTAVLAVSLLSATMIGAEEKPDAYDTFNKPWIDPAKWIGGLGCSDWTTLECVREIQHGRLRLDDACSQLVDRKWPGA